MDSHVKDHLERLKVACFNTYDITDAAKWITDNTFLNHERFSFTDHEYQLQILSDPSRVLNGQKCAQIGFSEVMARYGLALCSIIPGFSAIMTMPYSGDAENFMTTRIDPVIVGSDYLKSIVSPNLDNSGIKGIGQSLLYLRGTSGKTQALSIPADILIHDEIDKSDPAIIGQYQSRIRHSKWKLVRKFSTPTLAKRGIAAEMAISRRKHNICKCEHCNHYFVPDYFNHVHIPGYIDDIKLITQDNIRNIRWQEAVLLCPNCGKAPSLQPEHREWVMENASDNFEAVGYFCSPFDVPNITTTPELIMESTKYRFYSEFMNQALGLVAENSNEQITEADLLDSKTSIDLNSSNLHCMGADMGLTCHITIGRLFETTLLVVHRETVELAKFEERKLALQRQYRVLMTVMDSQPYTDLVLRLQKSDKNLYGAVYHNSKNLATYEIKMVDSDDAKGKLPINQVMIKRDLAFDEVMYLFKSEPKQIVWSSVDETSDTMYSDHLQDMKREQTVDKDNEICYTWTKSADGKDHYHHSTLYLYTACRLLPTFSKSTPVVGVPLMTKFKVKGR